MGFIPYETTQEDLNILSTFDESGMIHKYIRKKAEKQNPGFFTINALAEKVGVSPSMISRFESGEQHELKAAVLTRISQVISVPLEVFQIDYYKNNPRPFTICGVTHSIMNFELLKPEHRVHLSLKAYSPSGAMYKEFEEVVELSVLEYEEFIEEVQNLIDKVKKRRQTWKRKEEVINKMNDWQQG